MAYRFAISQDGHGSVLTDVLWLRAPLGLLALRHPRPAPSKPPGVLPMVRRGAGDGAVPPP
jgi:hypothetical protein